MKKNTNIYHLLVLFLFIVGASTYSALCFAGIGESLYSAAQLPIINSCSINRNLLSDEAEYQKTDITGALPYLRTYETSLSNNQNRLNYMTAGIKSIGGWSDNYSNYALVEDGGNGKDLRIRVRLPGDRDDTYYIYDKKSNIVQRIFSNTPLVFEALYLKYGNGNYNGLDKTGFISTEHRDRLLKMVQGGEDATKLKFYVKKDDVIYYINFIGDNNGNSNTKTYNVTSAYYPDGTIRGFSYQKFGNYPLIAVADNRGHILRFDTGLMFDGNEFRNIVYSVTSNIFEGRYFNGYYYTKAGSQKASYTYKRAG